MTDQFQHIRGPADFAAAFDVSRETIERLKAYEVLLRQWQKTINLVGPATLDDIWHRHFADSAQLLALAPAARIWADLGSGAGFPGLVTAILMSDAGRARIPRHPVGASPPPMPEACLRHDGEGRGAGGTPTLKVGESPPPCPSPTSCRRHAFGVTGEGTPAVSGEGTQPQEALPRVTLIDSSARKCAFLREVVRQTGMSDASQTGVAVEILSIRIANPATQFSLQAPEIVTARALAPLDRLLELAAPLSASHTTGLFLKGREVAKELEAALRKWDFRVELVQSCTEPDGRIVVVRRLEAKNRGMKP